MEQTIKSLVEQTTNAVIVESRIAQNNNYPYSGRFYTLEDVENILKHFSQRIIENLDGIEIPEPVKPSGFNLESQNLTDICGQVSSELYDIAVEWAQDCIRNFDFTDKVSIVTENCYGSSMEVRAEFEDYDLEDDVLNDQDELSEKMTERVEVILRSHIKSVESGEIKRDLVLERIEEGECDSHS
jgi:hypothetical protein